MKNTILNFDYLGSLKTLEGTYKIQEFSTYTNKIPTKYLDSKYYSNYTVQDDQKIENISYLLYGSTDYWDLILHFNEIKSPYLLPKNYDIVLQETELLYNIWLDRFKYLIDREADKDSYTKNYYDKLLKEKEDINEKYRSIKFIKTEYIQMYLKDIKVV